ncbi:MAG: UDP-N-acetylmuramoyl-L-alanine--D-glutamate ligase [Firmicutes bacterium]|nr:UDP-N-acetylmuramoyl-L-alanine--D-glutamate ligase [Bacillota bacterium]
MDKKNVLVIGLGKSGFATAGLLAGEAAVTCWDSKEESKFDAAEIAALKERGVRFAFGEAPSAKGFDLLVLSPGVPPTIPVCEEARQLGIEISGELEQAYEHCRGTFYAITGTNGKTTTTALTGEIFKAAGRKTEVVGNIGLPSSARALDADEDTCMVTEVSSFQLETIKEFKPKVSAILNITPDHLNRHGTFEEYARVKGLVFANQDESDYFVYNADDPETVRIVPTCKKAVKVAFSRRFRPEAPCAWAEDGKMYLDAADGEGPRFVIDTKDIYIPGAHNLENALAAAAVCFFAGIDTGVIARMLKEFRGVEHRIEFVKEVKGVRYVNDSKGTNPDASIKAIEATDTPILLIAGGYEKNSDFTDFINGFGGKVKYLLLLGQTAQRFADTARKCGFSEERMIFCADMKDVISHAYRLAEVGDTVLLSPASASWGMYNNYEERGEDFKQLVRELPE